MKNIFKAILFILMLRPFDGLTQNTDWISYTNGHKVVDVVKDSNILWIATTGGLVEINIATNDTVFLTKSNADFERYNITTIEADLQHNIWIGTDGDGIFKYDGSNWIKNPYGANLPTQYISDIKEDLAGNIWVGCKFWLEQTFPMPTPHYGGLVMYNGAGWINFTSYLNTNNFTKNVSEIECDKQGKMLISDGVLITYDGISWQYYNPSATGINVVNKFTLDTLNNVWLLKDSATLTMFNGTAWNNFLVAPAINSGFVFNHSITADSINNIWIGSDINNSLGLLKFDGSAWTNYTSLTSGLSYNRISSLYYSDNQVFIGANPGKLDILHSNQSWEAINTSNSLIYDNWLETVYVDTSGVAYTSSYNAIDNTSNLVLLNGQNWTFFDTIPTGPANAIYKDSQNNIWVGGYKGVALFNGINWTLFDTSNTSFPNNYVNSITEDSNAKIWIAGGDPASLSSQAYIAKYDGVNWTTYVPPLPIPYEFYKIIIDTSDNKWMASYNGLFEFDNLNQWHAYTNFNGPLQSDNETHDISYSPMTNALFLATPRGVIKKYLSNFSHVSYSYTRCVKSDNNGKIWTNPLGSDSLIIYDQNGQLINSFTSGNSGLPYAPLVHDFAISNSGKVYMATGSNGLVLFFDGNTVNVSETNSSKSNDFIVYPNPFLSDISIFIKKQNFKQATFTIKNILGQTVLRKEENNLNNIYTKTIDLGFLSKGIYLLDVNIDGERAVKKIVKE